VSKDSQTMREAAKRGSPSETFQGGALGSGDGSLRGEIVAQRDVSTAEWAALEGPTRGRMSSDVPRRGPDPDPPGGRKPAGRAMPPRESGRLWGSK
jgi:hypothetical protein